jgi:hypothetical protein
MLKWRNDYKPSEVPTDLELALCAEDEIRSDEGASGTVRLIIQHVETPKGKAFLPRIVTPSGSSPGELHYGESEEAYASALGEGESIFERKISELLEDVDPNDPNEGVDSA